jgi:hypothetical protein
VAGVWTKIVTWLYSHVTYLAGRYLYGFWSRLYRRLFERKYTQLPDDRPWTAAKTFEFFCKCTWVKDKWYMFWDAISKPAKFYETKQGDCDEFAAFAGYVMNDKVRWILSVTWYVPGKGKSFFGHNVLVYYDKEDGSWWYIDQGGYRGPFRLQIELIASIIPRKAIPCAYTWRNVRSLDYVGGGVLI